MGYGMWCVDIRFKIDVCDKSLALETLKRKFGDEKNDWVTLEEVLESYDWRAINDDDCNIADLTFEGENLHNEEELFRTLAPYVEEGSFIECHGDDDGHWRWWFHNKEFKEIYPTVTWENDEE